MQKKVLLNAILFALCAGFFLEPLQAAVKFTWGPYVRVRHEFYGNTGDLNSRTGDDSSFMRFKESLWAQTDISDAYSVYVKLSNESRSYFFRDDGGNSMYDINEAIFDNLYIDIKKPMGMPVDFRIGRMDLTPGAYGDGFIFGDGTPGDGSRTYYFNAAKANWTINPANKLEFIYIKNDRYDSFLPVMNEVVGRTRLNSSREEAYSLYHRLDVCKSFRMENYYVWKYEAASNTPLYAAEDYLHTLGAFGKYMMGPLSFRGQFAYQFDNQGADFRSGFGWYLFADAAFKETKWTPGLTAGYYSLSGDDRTTTKIEAFNPLFSRFPQFSDALALLFAREGVGIGYCTNMNLIRVGGSINPIKPTKISAFYNILTANQATFGNGKDRGTLMQVRIDQAINKYLSAFLFVESFTPGNFYAASSQDKATFSRAEVTFKF